MLEQQINGVENIDFITSNSSSDGVSSISVSFNSGTDGNFHQVNVQNRVSLAVVIFALGILAVFLVQSAQYESCTDPIIILLTVPTALLGPWCS